MPSVLTFLSVLAEDAGVVLPVCLDLDMSSPLPGLHFGVQRSPLRTPEAALALALASRNYPSLRLDALMGYEAQIAGVGDAAPGETLKNKVIQTLQRRSFAQVSQRRQATVKALHAAGFELTLINGGGTGSLLRTTTEPGLTELTAGSGFYAPTLFDRYQHLQLQPAAGFALAAVRKPAPGIYTCLGGGYIASGSIGPEKSPQPWLPPGQLLGLEGAGEVQTPVQFAADPGLELGDPILFRHAKAGELCEHFSRLHVLRQGEICEQVPTYRGEGQCFL
jgi:D-serine deaminase-like pyridoxal phosphate-dependent protein